MSELNFGLIDTSIPGKIADNYYTSQNELANTTLAQNKAKESTVTLANMQRQQAILDGIQTKIKSLGGPPSLQQAEEILMATGDPTHMQSALKIRQMRVGQSAMASALGLPDPNLSTTPSSTSSSSMSGAVNALFPATGVSQQAPSTNALASPSMPPLIDTQAGGLMMSGYEPAEKLGALRQEAYKSMISPQNMRPGSTIYVGQNPIATAPTESGQVIKWVNGQPVMSTMEGSVKSNAAITSSKITAEESARAPWTVVEVQQSDGSTVPTFKSNIPGAPGLAPLNLNAPDEATAQAWARQLQGKPFNITVGDKPFNGGATAPAVSPSAPTPWDTIPKMPTPKGIGQTTYNKAMQGKYAEVGTELSKKYGELAESAAQRNALTDQALGLVDKADTGTMAASLSDVKNLLTSRFGIPESSFENTPSATIALNKDLTNAATQKAKQQFGSRITQSEVNLMLQRASPGVDMPKAAIKYLLQSDKEIGAYNIRQANDLGKYLENGGDPNRFEGWYAKTFPQKFESKLTTGAAPAATQSAQSTGRLSTQEQTELDALRKRFVK